MELWWKRRFLYPNKWATNALMHCRRAGSFWSQSQVYAHQLVKREISQCLSRLVHLRRSFRFRGSRRLSVTKRIVNFYRYNQVHRFWWVQIRWRDQKLFRTQPHVLSVKLDSIWLRKVRWRCNYQRKHTYSRIIRQLVESKEIWSEPNDAFALGSGRRHWWSNWARRLKRLPTRRCRCIAKLYRKGLGLGIQDNFEPERSGYTLLDLLSDVGGLQGILISGISLILSIFNHNHLDNFLVFKLFTSAEKDAPLRTSSTDSIREFFLDKCIPTKLACCAKKHK